MPNLKKIMEATIFIDLFYFKTLAMNMSCFVYEETICMALDDEMLSFIEFLMKVVTSLMTGSDDAHCS